MVNRIALAVGLLFGLAPALARADAGDDSAPAAGRNAAGSAREGAQTAAHVASSPMLHHVPLAVARAHEDVSIGATIDRPDLVARVILVYYSQGQVREIDFARSSSDAAPYLAVIPAEHVVRPHIAYAIEIIRTDGAKIAAFATREAMQPVEVVGDYMDAREEALLARLHGRRFVVQAGGQYASFGNSAAVVAGKPATVNDSFYQVEGAFTYRMLRTVSEFGIRAGVLRGSSAVPDAATSSDLNVGLNYAAPWIRLRATDWLHFDGEILTSVTELGFSLGGGGAVHFGDPYASNLVLGFESIQVFGTRGYSRLEARALPWLTVAPWIEVTTMPHADAAGVRLLLDLGFDLGSGFALLVRGGYQARSFASGGPAAGGTLSYAF
jgi:hypothetical protein